MADPAEGLDHRDSGDELDHRGGDPFEFPVHFRRLLRHAPQCQAVGEPVHRHRAYGQQAQAPVEREDVHEQGERRDEGVRLVDGAVGYDRVDHRGVVLHRLAHSARALVGEPRKRRARKPLHDRAAQAVAHFEVCRVCEEERDEVEAEPGAVGGQKEHEDSAGPIRVDRRIRSVGAQQKVPQADEGDVGHDAEHGRCDREELCDADPPPDRAGQPLDGGLPRPRLFEAASRLCLAIFTHVSASLTSAGKGCLTRPRLHSLLRGVKALAPRREACTVTTQSREQCIYVPNCWSL